MKHKITKRAVDALTTKDHQVLLWDSEVKGFGVRCSRTGAKRYVLKFRTGGRQRWIMIGRHGSPWTPDTARAEAMRLLGLKAGGMDPARERDQQKGVITVAELGARFLSDYVAERCKPNTVSEYRYLVDAIITQALGQHRITEVTRADIAELHHRLRDRPYQANRALAVMSKMFNLAEGWGLRPDGSNPCRHLKKYREQKRERYLSTEEMQRLGQTLADAQQGTTENPHVLAAIGLLILTGARLREILTLRWDYVDFTNGVLKLPDSKTGAKPVYLNEAAAELLRALPRMKGNPHVIAGQKPGAHLVELQKPWRRIRANAGLKDVRIHDLRHSFAAVAAGSGMSLPIIGKLLGHTQPITTARYAHLAADPMRAASELIGSRIMAVMAPQAVTPNPAAGGQPKRPHAKL